MRVNDKDLGAHTAATRRERRASTGVLLERIGDTYRASLSDGSVRAIGGKMIGVYEIDDEDAGRKIAQGRGILRNDITIPLPPEGSDYVASSVCAVILAMHIGGIPVPVARFLKRDDPAPPPQPDIAPIIEEAPAVEPPLQAPSSEDERPSNPAESADLKIARDPAEDASN